MPDSRPLSLASVRVLSAIASGNKHGFDIMDAVDLASGTVYPILARLEKGGLLRGRWESAAMAQREKRPPRRYYEITASGSKALADSAQYYRTLGGGGALPLPRPSRG